ncbi:sensor domain-containing diguanylate cyclase [Deinococcus indicus]|uniref:sensor domain-containing diguanylate cyclase n=1 Tax=Deinococcus indicus TaxID=223556 RepID=UPI001554CF6B|nr:sensor domain-containing diguanylate cyclase [Deinococcus indicus]
MSHGADTEQQRLAALARYAVLDTLPERAFDRVTHLAARLFGAPIALISLVDQDRQWFKACLGLDTRQTDRSLSFCAHTILGDGVMVIPDARQDPRFAGNALVTGEPFIRFYAGAPLVTPDGFKLGSLCVIDPQPRAAFSAEDQAALTDLAGMVVSELELRFTKRELETEAQGRAQMVRFLRETQAVNEALLGVSTLTQLDLPPQDTAAFAIELIAQAGQVDWAALAAVEAGGSSALNMWNVTPAGEAFSDLMPRHLPPGQGVVWSVAQGVEARYERQYAALPDASEAVVQAGAQAIAWLPLGTYGEQSLVMIFAVLRPEARWSARHRELFEAAANVMRQAMSMREITRQASVSARTDLLTGLGNRRAFLEDAEVPSGQLGVVDVDGLKGVNDTQGHAAGDELLRVFGGALRDGCPPGGAAYRIGGDEFALLLPGGGRGALEGWVTGAVAAVHAAGFPEAGASFGAAHWPGGAEDHAAALQLADHRLYEQKRSRTPSR